MTIGRPSTGMAGSNPQGTALVTGLIAVQPHDGAAAELQVIPSPLQCPALEYGSSFSRALEVSTPDLRRLFVSGTASIGSNGLEIVHVGDTNAQVARTVEVITAIANDISYDEVFIHQLKLVADPGDVVMTVSSSGDSENVVRAAKWAREFGLGSRKYLL